MIAETEDTIAAIATPPGRSALGIVRISGKECRAILPKIFHPKHDPEIVPFRPILGRILMDSEKWIDEALLLFFEKPHSYTREDLVEICCHGNPLILDRVLEKTLRSGARLAKPGEFTYRAFLNGRIDLVQAEAVQDLITADTSYQMELALNQLEGRLSGRFQDLSSKLVELISLMEGNVDFTEEQHYEFISRTDALERIDQLMESVRSLVGTFERGKWIRDGFRVALIGKPNVGKSSLFNALLENDRAIVTSIAGTTRDYLQERITLGNHLIQLYDTAGIREGLEEIEREGIRRSLQVIEKADLIVFILDGAGEINDEDKRLWKEIGNKDKISVCNKLDCDGFQLSSLEGTTSIAVSATAGTGLSELKDSISRHVDNAIRYSPEDYFISSARHRDILKRTQENLRTSAQAVQDGLSEELPLIHLHSALRDLGEITGQVTIDDIYQQIFQNFCIGK